MRESTIRALRQSVRLDLDTMKYVHFSRYASLMESTSIEELLKMDAKKWYKLNLTDKQVRRIIRVARRTMN